MTRTVLAAMLACACAVSIAGAAPVPSPLAFAHVGTSASGAPDLLAQRTIERTWGPSEDSSYRVVEVKGWKSEALAMSASALLPGAGEMYVGEKSGLWFAVAEVAGWTARTIFEHDANRLRDRAARVAGAPSDTASAWSFERWSDATGRDPGELEQLYRVDRESFYDLIGQDPSYAAGWRSGVDAGQFEGLRAHANDDQSRVRWSTAAVFLNHVLSAADALKAARLNNIPLQKNLELQLKAGWHTHATVVAMVERRF